MLHQHRKFITDVLTCPWCQCVCKGLSKKLLWFIEKSDDRVSETIIINERHLCTKVLYFICHHNWSCRIYLKRCELISVIFSYKHICHTILTVMLLHDIVQCNLLMSCTLLCCAINQIDAQFRQMQIYLMRRIVSSASNTTTTFVYLAKNTKWTQE